MTLTISGTGHRPNSLKGGYQEYPNNLKPLIEIIISVLKLYPVTEVQSGMALGFDTALAIAAIKSGIKLSCQIPFPEFESRWNDLAKSYYYQILDKAYNVNYVSETKPKSKQEAVNMLMLRNKILCDNADALLSFWNGSNQGGTYNAINYFQMVYPTKNIVNLYDLYQLKTK